MSILSDAVQALENLQHCGVCCSIEHELQHLISVGQGLENTTASVSQIRDFANATKSYANVAGASSGIGAELNNIATTLIIGLNNANPLAYLVPGNPNFVLHPYDPRTTDPLGCQGSTPGYYHTCGCNPPPNMGIYWTGILILAGCIGGALLLGKVRG